MHWAIAANPDVALILIALGLLGVCAEFCAPGKIFPGAIGAMLCILGLISLSSFFIYAPSLVLIVLAIILFGLEARFVSRGILTLVGAVTLIAGLKNLIAADDSTVRIHWATAVCIAIPFSLAASFLLSVALRARRNKAVNVEGDMLK